MSRRILFVCLLLAATASNASAGLQEDFVAPYRAHLGEPLLTGRGPGETYRAIEIPPVEPALSIRVDVDAHGQATLTVKRLIGLQDQFKGVEVVGRRQMSPIELSAFRATVDHVRLWRLPAEMDDAAEWDKRPHAAPVPAPVPSGRDYTSNKPLTVVCADSMVTVLEIETGGNAHAVYRDCHRTDIRELEDAFYRLATPYLRR